MVSWYRRFIPNAASITSPLNALLRKTHLWQWGDAQEQAFNKLKELLSSTPILACPDFSKPFTLQSDASTTGIGAVLTQEIDNAERVIAYVSRSLDKAEKNYTVTELECLAVVWSIRKLRAYIEGYHFTVITDHQSLQWLRKIDNPSGRLARWALELQQYDFEVKYRKGSENVIADALSRQHVNAVTTKCEWYKKIMQEVKTNPEDNPDYCIDNGRLYKHVLSRLDFNDASYREDWKLCIPRDQRATILYKMHDDPTAGHLGVAKTLARWHAYTTGQEC